MFDRNLKMPRIQNMSGSEYIKIRNRSEFWICQGSEYTKVLNMKGFWIYQGSQ